MSVLQEFKKFALRGNVIDMAVGIIIGGAFGTLVKSLVDDVIMPPIGAITSNVDFKEKSIEVRPEQIVKQEDGTETKTPPVVIRYGAFINSAISFFIVAWAVFLLVKAVNTAETKIFRGEEPPEAVPPPSEEVVLLREIRDSLKRG